MLRRIKGLLFAGTVLALSGCATTTNAPGEQTIPAPGPVDDSGSEAPRTNNPSHFVLAHAATQFGTPDIDVANNFLGDGPRLQTLLKRMSKPQNRPGNPNLRTRLARMRASQQSPRGLTSANGLGGAYADALLLASEGRIGVTDDYDQNKSTSVDIAGRIVDYEYDVDDGSGELLVETVVTNSVENVPIQISRYTWTIHIRPGGFSAHQVDPNDPNRFDVPMTFDGDTIERIDEKGFNWKLWAKGANSIWVDSVRHQFSNLEDPSKDFDKYLHRSHAFMRPNPENCIDLMFVVPEGGRIPRDIDELQTHSYCLGRCANPMVVNTGE